MLDDKFPLEFEDFVGCVVEVLFHRQQFEAGLLAVDNPIESLLSGRDNLDGGYDIWDLTIRLPSAVYYRSDLVETWEPLAGAIESAGNEVLRQHEARDIVGNVHVRPGFKRREPNSGWRQQARRALGGDGLSNQGRVRSDNLATHEHEGLLFRSEAEINLYRALKSLGLAVAPLPVFVQGGQSYQRIEPDFVIVKQGKTMVVEVDGDRFHQESPADADSRLAFLLEEGVQVMRINASECATPACARNAAKEVLNRLTKLIGI